MEIEILKKESDNNIDLKPQELRWKNRRRMAWISLISMILVTGTLLFAPISIERLKTLGGTIEWYFLSMASIVGAYMGFTTWASKGAKK